MDFEMIPTFPTADLDATVAFWATLGFVEDHRADDSLGLRHPNGIELHFWLDTSREPLLSDVSAYLRFATGDQARALYDEWKDLLPPTGLMTAPEDTGYGLLEWYLLDQHRNLIRVGGRLHSIRAVPTAEPRPMN